MPSAWVEQRSATDGVRYRVRYRVAGQGSVGRYGGSFRTRDEAMERVRWCRKELSAMRIPNLARFNGRRPPKVKDAKQKALDQVYSDARKLSQQMSLLRDGSGSSIAPLIAEAELLTMKATDLVFDAWTKAQT